MRLLEIPFDASKSSCFTQTFNADGQTFSISATWNERDNSFFVDFKTNEGEKKSVRICPNRRILGKNNGVTDGDFILLSTDANADADNITYSQYGTMWKLYFVPKGA